MYHYPITQLGLPIILVLMMVGLLILAFEVWMLVDAIRNKKITPEERAIWVVGMLLLHPFVAIAYYFMRRSSLLK